MSPDYDFMDGGEGQMFHDFYNNYENGEAEVECPYCGTAILVDGDASDAVCPLCGAIFEIEETERN